VVAHAAGRVVRAPAEERELDADALVQGAEGADPVGRDDVRDDEDGPAVAQRRASS
jgi:hypothetical protein